MNLSHNNSQMENNPSKPSTLTFKSILNPEQLKVHSLYEKCGVKIDANTFSKPWKLCELGIPTKATVALMNDIAKLTYKEGMSISFLVIFILFPLWETHANR